MSFYIEWCKIWSSCNQHIVKAVRCPSNHLFMSTWQVPYDGPVDSSFLISATSGQSAVPALPAPAETQPLGVFHAVPDGAWDWGRSVSETRHLYCLNPVKLGSFNPISLSCHLPWQSVAQPLANIEVRLVPVQPAIFTGAIHQAEAAGDHAATEAQHIGHGLIRS